ncbi:MAG TPA: hypothetical protein VF101_12280 [Gaiellaceae bacterium]
MRIFDGSTAAMRAFPPYERVGPRILSAQRWGFRPVERHPEASYCHRQVAATDAANGGAGSLAAREAPKKSERRANRAARLGAVAVATLGLFIVFLPIARNGQHWAVDPDEARTTTSATVESQFGGVTTTTIVSSKAGTTTTAVSRSPAPDTKLTFSSAEEKRSLLERAFGAGGFFLFRLALVATAAFLTGAIIQRTWLARFAVKFPFVTFDEVSEAADASTVAIKALQDELAKESARTDLFGETLVSLGGKTSLALDDLSARIGRLDERTSAIEHRRGRQ